MTGSVDGASNQVAGTVPLMGPPGEENDGIAPRVVATSVESADADDAWLEGRGAAADGDAGRGAAALPPDSPQAVISTHMAKAVRPATRHRRLTSPGPAE